MGTVRGKNASGQQVSWRALKGGRFQLELWALPTTFTVVLLPGISWLFLAYRKNPTFFEKAIAFVLLGLAFVSIVQFIRALLLLRRSGEQLESSLTVDKSWKDLPNKTVHRVPTWFSKVIAAANIRAEMDGRDSRESDIQVLPEAEELVAPARAAAEKAAIFLRWFSTSAVLVGLVGTFIGLIDAVGGALNVLNADGGNLVHADFARALGPLQFCFISSIGGVATSFALGLLRMVYEADLDAHFAELSFALRTRIQDFYPNWRSPEARLVDGMTDLKDAATSLRAVGTDMNQLGSEMKAVVSSVETLAKEIERNTGETIKTTVKLFSEQLANELPKITKGVNEGLDEGTKRILERIVLQENETRERLAARAQDFLDKLEKVRASFEKGILDTIGQLEQTAAAFSEGTRDAAGTLAATLRRQIDEVATRQAASAEALGTVGESVTAAAVDGARASEAIRAQLETQRTATQELATLYRELTAGITKASEDLDARFTELPGAFEQPRVKLEELLGKLEKTYVSAARSAFDVAAASVSEAAGKLGGASIAAAKVVDALAKAVQPATDSVKEATAAAGRVLEEGRSIREQIKSEKESLRDVGPFLGELCGAIAEQTIAVRSAALELKNAIAIATEESRAVDEALVHMKAVTRGIAGREA